MTLLVDGFLDTVQRRYSGLEMERQVPCPGRAGVQCNHYFKLANLENRLNQEPPILAVECEECTTKHEVAKLLFGLSLLPAVEAITVEEIRRVVSEENEKRRAKVDQSLKEYIQLQFIKEWNRQQNIENQSCPTVFSLYSLDGGTAFQTEKLRIQLYCMKPGCWHSVGAKGRREFAPPREWAAGTLRFLSSFSAVLRTIMIMGAATLHPAAALGLGISAADAEQMRNDFDATAKMLAEWEKLSPKNAGGMESLVSDSRAPRTHEVEGLRDLKTFPETLFTEKKPDGSMDCGLEHVRTPEDHVMWLCPKEGSVPQNRRFRQLGLGQGVKYALLRD